MAFSVKKSLRSLSLSAQSWIGYGAVACLWSGMIEAMQISKLIRLIPGVMPVEGQPFIIRVYICFYGM
jgi:hypothetical protein